MDAALKALPVLALALLGGCSGLYNYEQTPGSGARPAAADSYVVRAGDTLYSIAFAHDLDYRELAAWNGLSDPGRIYVGQRLVLAPGSAAASAPRPAAGSSAGSSAPPPRAQAPAQTPAAAPTWQWPVRGAIVTRFGDSGTLSSGIGIAGTAGNGVHAAAAGRVVYAGSGLRDYGQLVIIEHNATWLSAYGYNRRLLVGEGDAVRQGQRIAEMGTGPNGAARLHFEIRRNGDPIDPLSLLPRE